MGLFGFSRSYFKKCGRKGGLKGGPARAEALSAKRRKEIASMGGLAKKAKRKNGHD